MGQSATKPRRRANGEGSIYYVEADGRWRGALAWTDEASRSRRRTVTGRTQGDVRRKLTELRAELDKGRAPASGITVAAFLGGADSGWLRAERQRIRPSTWLQRDQYARTCIVPAIGKLALAKLTPGDVETMTAGLIAAGKAPRTAAHARTILRRALGDAQRDGLVHRNVAALARPPRVPQTTIKYLDVLQLRTLLAAVADHPLGPLVTLAATTGMRQGEMLGLGWADVDLEAGSLMIRRSLARAWTGWALAEPKTPRSRRSVRLPAVSVAALRRQRERQDADRAAAGTAWQDIHGLVFTDAIGRPLVNSHVSAVFQRSLRDAGLPAIPFHGLRHSAATALLAGGIPLRVVSDVLGHSTISITADTYAAVVPELRRDAADAMDRALG